MKYRLFINADRTLLVRLWPDGKAEVATRETSDHVWGLPVVLSEERV